MERGPQPPVNEVVLSVAIDGRDELVGPNLPHVLGPWFANHPLVQTFPPYEMPVERPGSMLPASSFQLVEASIEPRYLLRTTDEREVIQVQRDYLALGWRRRDTEHGYVHYSTLRDRFRALLDDIALKLNDGLQPVRAEINYTNIIGTNSLWSKTNEIHKLLQVPKQDGDYETLSFAFTRQLHIDGRFSGRLRVAIQPGVDAAKQEPRINLTIVARSADLKDATIQDAINFLDLAHDAANVAFRGLLTDEARRLWGFE